MDWILHQCISTTATTIGVGHWISDATRHVYPVRCHSHNDYWRTVPLIEAIAAGCPSVEAAVWYRDDDLYVGHREFELRANRTLRSLYIDPLIDIIESQNTMPPCDPGKPAVRLGRPTSASPESSVPNRISRWFWSSTLKHRASRRGESFKRN